MADEILFDVDPLTGRREWFSTDADTGISYIRHEQDISADLDACKEAQAEGFDKRADLWHAAHIPDMIIYEWIAKHGVNLYDPNHKDGVRRLLNSSDYRWLRVKNFII